MEELNKGYEFTKAQIAELTRLRAFKAEIEKQEPVAWWNGKETAFFEHETDGPVGEVRIPLFSAPVVSPDVEKLKAENQSLKNEAAFWKQETKTWADKHDELAESFQCHPNRPVIERLKTELEAAQADAERYLWLRERVGVEREYNRSYAYLPCGNSKASNYTAKTDSAIDAAIEQAKGGV